MKIALIYDPQSKHGAVWLKWLTEDGHTVVAIKDETAMKELEAGNFDIVIPLITIRDYVNQPNPRMDALLELEAENIKLLTSSASIAASSDKLLTYQFWEKSHIKQPATSLYDEAQDYRCNKDHSLIIKPRFGHSGNNVFYVQTLNELRTAAKHIDDDALVQEYIVQPTCIRLIATDRQVLCAYEKVLEDHVVVSIEKGAVRKYFEAFDDLVHFALVAVKALGGGLMGLDILEKGGEYIALEANVPFGFDEHNDELRLQLLRAIKEY